MKKFNKLVFITLILTGCTNEASSFLDSSFVSNSVVSSSNSVNSISSSIDSAQRELDDSIKQNKELDEKFKAKLNEQKSLNGELFMYKLLELKYAKASTMVRKKAIYQMILNPRLDYYLNSKYLKDYRMQDHMIELILDFENIIFFAEDISSGISLPYVIILPDEKYKQENINYKNYAFFQMGGSPVNNQPYFSLLNGLMQHVLNKEFVLNTIPNELYAPKIVAFIPAPCLFNNKRNSFVGNRYLDRDNVYAIPGQYNDYKVCNEVFGDFDNSTNNPDTFTEYTYSQQIDIELQNRQIIEKSISFLKELGYKLEDKVFMTGYSNNGLYTSRFTTIYPELLKATFDGGTIPLMMPTNKLNNQVLNYPLGTADHEELFGKPFDLEAYNKVAKLKLIGMNEDWNAVPLDRYDNIHTRYFELFGAYGPSQYFTILNNFYNLGGNMLNIINKGTGHYMSENDGKLIKEFFQNNRNDDEKWYPNNSTYQEHILISEKNLNPLLELIKQYPKRNYSR